MYPAWLQTLALAGLLISITLALDLPEYRGLKTSQNARVLEITLHNPTSPINVWNHDFQTGLADIVQRLQSDNETKVVIFKSDVPGFVELMYNISNLPQVTIGAVDGRARGAGNELLMGLDMRFATKYETLLGQLEVATGLIPGGGGSQHLPGLIGRGLAMEYILSGKDINAQDAERIGWINKAFDTSSEMYAYIDELTSRLVLYPLPALAAAKESINLAARPPLENLLQDVASFNRRIADPIVSQLLGKSLSLTNNQSLGEVELNMGRDLPLLYT
ncbi:ClpP/crotonase-like domain-containing protein [Fusarium sp. MPI-SDFR-AT-0072]|nr:ClpP/crotonase-like domain-containing protein [Fusarium sp. MPI-SDFR-AT-0072]